MSPRDADTRLEPGRMLAGRYLLVRPLGTGASSTWLARDEAAGRDVALKFPRAAFAGHDAIDQARAEVSAAASVTHPALLNAGRLDHADGLDFIVMEYLPGGDIGSLRGRPWRHVLRRALPVVEALGALHEAGYVHGDVKSANVLLDADGSPKLADLGTARRIGDEHAVGGSPYGVSPQQLDGRPAAVSDDVYSIGALLYELVSGHPPFYPDVTPDRVRNEAAPPMPARPDLPQQLRDVIARCLEKDPARRPAAMWDVARELRACLGTNGDTSPGSGARNGWMPRPPVEPPSIRPVPRRAEGAGPSAHQLRSEGFRRGIVVSAFVIAIVTAVFVFFVLPGLVETKSADVVHVATQPATTAAVDAVAPVPANLEKLAELKGEVDRLRSALAPRIGALQSHDVVAWGATAFTSLQSTLAASDRSAAARDYASALASLKEVEQAVASLEKQRVVAQHAAESEGRAALDAGRSAEARQRFEAALRIEPASAAARQGLKRASVLDDVLRETASGERHEQDGNWKEAADAYRRALGLDPESPAARAGLARSESRLTGDAYSQAVAQGLSALSRKDYPAARAAFERAGRLRPGAPEVADGLRQVEQALSTRDLSAIVGRGEQAEREERWSDALIAYRAALKSDATLLSAQQGIDRAEPRAMLDAELQVYLDRPDRLFSQEGRGAAGVVLQRAQQVPQPGPRLSDQIVRLAALVKQAGTPVHVALASDNVTDVQIYRVGRLGTFDHRELDLMPGKYTAVGTRAGYRDVRREFTVLPGAPPPALVIRCEEPI